MDTDLRRPSLLRSPLLWIGLVVMVFLGWAWRDSLARWFYLRYGRVAVMSQASGVTIKLTEMSYSWRCRIDAPATFGIRPDSDYSGLLELRLARPIAREFTVAEWRALAGGKSPAAHMLNAPELYRFWAVDGNKNSRLVFIPYWCLMLAALLPWLGLIYWRHRRIHRLPAAVTPEPEIHHDA